MALSGDPIARYWLAPHRAMVNPDPWQREALTQLVTKNQNILMLCTRGGGKTETFSLAAYLEASLGGFAMVLSRSDRQAMRVISRALLHHRRLNLVPKVTSNQHEMTFRNGGRILALPCSGDTIVGEHGITLLGIDEAARIKDEFYAVVTPMLIVSEAVTGVKPRMALLSTPFGERGFFWRAWTGEGGEDWERFKFTWRDCPRISEANIEEERLKHGDDWIRQEYECEFLPTVGSIFNVAAFTDLVVQDRERLF